MDEKKPPIPMVHHCCNEFFNQIFAENIVQVTGGGWGFVTWDDDEEKVVFTISFCPFCGTELAGSLKVVGYI